MATETLDRTFVDSILKEIVYPARDELMDSPYFTDLRNGTLTTRRMQGFSLQHTWFNRALLKGSTLRALKLADHEDAFMNELLHIQSEITHPDMCKKFGLSLGLTDEDFANEQPLLEVQLHTAIIVAGPLLGMHPATGRVGGMSDETMVQRFSTEFMEYLPKPPYDMSADAIEFFTEHAVVDVDHAEMGAQAVARLVSTDREKEIVWEAAKQKTQLKLAKWRAIYDHYA
jgi:pyrroloquinoline quinone (PQQ) biosynthesis protein C